MVIQNKEFWSYWNQGDFEQALSCSINEQKKSNKRLQMMLFGTKEQLQQTGAVASISAGEFMYDYFMINPEVVKGIDFARADDLSSLFTLSQFAKGIDTSVATGDMAQMQGYVAEQMLAAELQAKGHDVEFPEESNNPGWDLLIDGQPFQVKNLANPDGVREHLERYPDIPVYVNEELAPYFTDHPNVYVSSISREEVLDATETTLNHAADLLDFEIPWISAGVSSFYNIHRLWKDEVTINQAVINVVSDTSSRFALGVLGEKTGIMLGAMLFGPAGGMMGAVFGAFLGVSQGGKLSTKIKRTLSKQKEKELILAVDQLVQKAGQIIENKRGIKNRKLDRLHENIEQSAAGKAIEKATGKHYRDQMQYMNHKWEELQAIMSAVQNGKRYSIDALPMIMMFITKSGIHPVHIQDELIHVQEKTKVYFKRI